MPISTNNLKLLNHQQTIYFQIQSKAIGIFMLSNLLRANSTKYILLTYIAVDVILQVRCHRENLQGSTSLHFVGSHNGNGLWETDWAWMLSYK